jgi:hypothetical protein
MADDAEPTNTVMEMVETSRLELAKPARYHTTPASDTCLEAASEMDVDAVREEVAATKPFGIIDQIIDVEADGGVIGCDYGTGAHPDEAIDWDAVPDQLAQDADMRRPTQAASAQNHSNPNPFPLSRHDLSYLTIDRVFSIFEKSTTNRCRDLRRDYGRGQAYQLLV